MRQIVCLVTNWTNEKRGRLHFMLLLTLLPLAAGAQSSSALAKNLDTALSDIQFHPGSQPFDSIRFNILQRIDRHCGNNFDCLYRNYSAVIYKLEDQFKLRNAIAVGEQLIKIAQKHKAIEAEAQTNLDLFRYHDALYNSRQAASCILKALRLFKKTGNKPKVTLCKYWKLTSSLNGKNTKDVLPELENLLKEALLQKDSKMVVRLLKDLTVKSYTAGQFEKTTKHLDTLESRANPNPQTNWDRHVWIVSFQVRGDLSRREKAFEKAESFYQQALQLSRENSDRWHEIRCLHSLAETAWELDKRAAAMDYLNQALAYSENLKLDDMLSHGYQLQARFAEAEGRYADALEFTRKMQKHQDSLTNRGSGHNARNYFLEVEKETLEKERRERENMLRNLFWGISFILILTAILLWASIKFRAQKRELAGQNKLIRQQSEELKSLDAAKSRFFANISHELRTPLTLLLGPIQSLQQESTLSEKQMHLLRMARRSGMQLKQLINEILDLRKLEMGKMELQEEPTTVLPFFQSYIAQFESLAERMQIEFLFKSDISPNLIVNLDREKCRQILYNLMSNAFKFTPEGGRIETSLSLVQDRFLELRVADNGPGIHPEDQPHVFDRFFQTNRPDKPAEGGTGIGLNLCREYARLFGGDISVESTPDVGAAFTISFPVTPLESKRSEVSSPVKHPEILHDDSPIPTAGSTKGPEQDTQPGVAQASDNLKPSLLVVEDNPDLRDYIRVVLQEKYAVITAENGQAALGRLKSAKRQPALILSDLMMPVMDGFQLLEQLKSSDSTRHIPVIMLTARAEVRDKLKALRIGVDDYLLKPFDEEELLARIQNLLKNQSIRQKNTATPEAEQEQDAIVMSEADQEWLESFEDYIQKHFSEEGLSVTGLALDFAMSESSLLRQLKRLTGLSPAQYIQEMRLDEARQILENREANSISQVASKVGYRDTRAFSRTFRARFGKLPSDMLAS